MGGGNAPDSNRVTSPATLPQGAPTSPAISNLAAYRLDLRLNAYAQIHSYTYSRYADDLTFSGKLDNKIKKHVVRKIVTAEAFILNERKGSYITRSDRQVVTGLNVNEKVSISKKFRKRIATHLHNCIQFGPDAHLEKIGRKHRYNYRDWLFGNILYIHSVHPEIGAAMRSKFDRINWV
jgi:retron-type reverse transcriptase